MADAIPWDSEHAEFDAALEKTYRRAIERIDETKPDCDLLLQMELVYMNVGLLEGYGILESKFAGEIQEALDLNKAALLGMKPEARQKLKLAAGDFEVIPIPESDRLPTKPKLPDPLRVVIPPEDESDSGSYSHTPSPTDMIAPEDDINDAYKGVKARVRWQPENRGNLRTLLSPDRVSAYWRFVAATKLRRGLIVAGGAAVIIGAGVTTPWVTVPAVMAAGRIIQGGLAEKPARVRERNRADRRAGRRSRASIAADLTGLVGQGVTAYATTQIKYIVNAIVAALYRRGAETTTMWMARNFRAFVRRIPLLGQYVTPEAEFDLFTASVLGDAGADMARRHPHVWAAAVALLRSAPYISAAYFATLLTNYLVLHHGLQYVPARQRYYLNENDQEEFTEWAKHLRSVLDQEIKPDLRMWPNGYANKNAYQVRMVTLRTQIAAGERARRAVVVNPDDLEQACQDVSAVVDTFIQLQTDVDQLLADVTNGRPPDDQLIGGGAGPGGGGGGGGRRRNDGGLRRLRDDDGGGGGGGQRQRAAGGGGGGGAAAAPPPPADDPMAGLAPLAPVAPVAPGEALAALNAVGGGGQGASAVDEVFARLRL